MRACVCVSVGIEARGDFAIGILIRLTDTLSLLKKPKEELRTSATATMARLPLLYAAAAE